MSQNKTVIQGLEPNDSNFGGASMGASPNFYARGNRSAARGTVVPGMSEAQGVAPSGDTTPISQPKKAVHSGKPVVGFLYSVSRTPLGEFWPVQMGKNTIGQSVDSDIILAEATVSTNHAVIITRMGKNGIIAAIKDTESTNGTFINGEPIDFSAEECHNGDIITIGSNYQFLFILIDAAQLGLSTNKDFISVVEEESEDDEPEVPTFGGGITRPGGGFDPFTGGPTSWGNTNGGGNSNGGTVGLDGSLSGGEHGGTIPM